MIHNLSKPLQNTVLSLAINKCQFFFSHALKFTTNDTFHNNVQKNTKTFIREHKKKYNTKLDSFLPALNYY